MLRKKIVSLLLSASFLTPAAVAAIEDFDPECVDAATNFIEPNSALTAGPGSILYAAPVMRGDVNRDWEVNISDYTLLRRYLNSDGEISINKRNADVNADGEVNFLDLLALKSMV